MPDFDTTLLSPCVFCLAHSSTSCPLTDCIFGLLSAAPIRSPCHFAFCNLTCKVSNLNHCPVTFIARNLESGDHTGNSSISCDGISNAVSICSFAISLPRSSCPGCARQTATSKGITKLWLSFIFLRRQRHCIRSLLKTRDHTN